LNEMTKIVFTLIALSTIVGEYQYTYGPQLVDNIVVEKARLRNASMIRDLSEEDWKTKFQCCCDFLTTGHEIESGKGTVIAIRIFHNYYKDSVESGGFIKYSIYLSNELATDKQQEDITFDLTKGMLGYISSGAVSDPMMWSCFSHINSGTINIKYLENSPRMHIELKLQASPKRLGQNANLECHEDHLEYSGYFYKKNLGELDVWEGKEGNSYYQESSPKSIKYRDFNAK